MNYRRQLNFKFLLLLLSLKQNFGFRSPGYDDQSFLSTVLM